MRTHSQPPTTPQTVDQRRARLRGDLPDLLEKLLRLQLGMAALDWLYEHGRQLPRASLASDQGSHAGTGEFGCANAL